MKSLLLLSVFATVIARGGCDPAPRYDPCAGRVCGEPCTVCAPDDADCLETMVLKGCDPDGACVAAGTFACEPSDPCTGKTCGEPCSTCDPALGACPAVMQYCDAEGACGTTWPACPATAR